VTQQEMLKKFSGNLRNCEFLAKDALEKSMKLKHANMGMVLFGLAQLFAESGHLWEEFQECLNHSVKYKNLFEKGKK